MASSRRILTNILSNWANLVISVFMAFFVSPIVVHGLGKETYGVWVLIVSVTGYFTVLDFGINTAIVRYISKYVAEGNTGQARRVYSTAISVFGVMALTIICLAALLGPYFPKLFGLQHFGSSYIYLVFFLACVDLAFGLLFSVFLGSLCGLQEFRFVNGVAIGTNLIKNLLIVFFISRGYSLLSLILLQIFGHGFSRSLPVPASQETLRISAIPHGGRSGEEPCGLSTTTAFTVSSSLFVSRCCFTPIPSSSAPSSALRP